MNNKEMELQQYIIDWIEFFENEGYIIVDGWQSIRDELKYVNITDIKLLFEAMKD